MMIRDSGLRFWASLYNSYRTTSSVTRTQIQWVLL